VREVGEDRQTGKRSEEGRARRQEVVVPGEEVDGGAIDWISGGAKKHTLLP
jgi:hypothetical protein